jgi:hypothetical protein
MIWNIAESANAGSRFFIKYSGGTPDATDLQDIATGVRTAFNTDLKALMSSEFSLAEVISQDLNSSSGLVGTDTTVVAGTRSGAALPASIGLRYKFHIARHYRGGKSGMVAPFGAIGDEASQNSWSSGFAATCASSWATFMAAVLATTMHSVTLSEQVSVSLYHGYNTSTPPWRGPGFKYPPAYKSSPVTPEAVTTVDADTRYGSVRRRLNL